MTIGEACDLIKTNRLSQAENQLWADLGCGDGLFSKALITLLPASANIIAIDQRPAKISDPLIQFRRLDFEKDDLVVPLLDGIMMINALHFVRDKLSLLRRLRHKLKASGLFLLGEYDLKNPNRYVPYPIALNDVQELFEKAGFGIAEKINSRKSRFNNSEIYSVCIFNK